MAYRRHGALALAIASLVLALLPSAVVAADPAAAEPSDFNGDGYADLAIGVRQDGFGAGSVNVLYGSATGLSATGDQSWTLASSGFPSSGFLSNYWFGRALASGDFDDDGFIDLAVSADKEPSTPEGIYGSVTILYGSAAGLKADGAQQWTDDDIDAVHGAFGSFGEALASGDFDGDGYPDLAIGVLWGGPMTGNGSGAVDVLFGGPDGLSATGAMQIMQASPGVPGDPEDSAGFGEILASGDFTGDGIDDLAIGRSRDSLGPDVEGRPGAVNVLYGTVDGLSTAGAQFWSQATPGIAGVPEQGERFGSALAIGDFDRDGYGDLAIGVPGDRIGTSDIGGVNVIYGSAAGLTADGSQQWQQGTPGVPGSNEDGDGFGGALAAGDFDSDGADDLAIGAPFEGVGSVVAAGAMTLLYGSNSGLRASGSVAFTQNSAGVPGSSERSDRFGSALAAGNFGRSGRDDLAVGVYHEDVGGISSAGIVNVLYGRLTGMNGTGAQSWSQDSPGIKGTAFRSDYFGWALTP